MKQKIKLTILFALFVLCLGVMASCKTEPTEPTMLEAPQNLALDECEILSWDAVEHAEGYCVEIGENDYKTTETSLDLFEILSAPGEYTISVYARGNNETTTSSDYATITHSVNSPTGLAFALINNGTEYAVKAGNKEKLKGKIIIPTQANGKPVTSIVTGGFVDCKNITGMLIPDCVTELGKNAFCECSALVRVRLPIVNSIPLGCFKFCSSLQMVNIAEGCYEIGLQAFGNCINLKNISLPSTTNKIDSTAFSDCNNMENVAIAQSNRTYYNEGSCVITKADNTLIIGGVNAEIPKTVTVIDSFAFAGRNIKSIVIPSNVKKISSWAFYDCTKLTDVTIEEGLTTIGYAAFSGCGFEKITLPKSLTTLGGIVFSGCNALKKLNIPKNVDTMITTIAGPIGYCENLTELTVDSANHNYFGSGNCIVETATGTLVQGTDTSVIPDGVKIVGNGAFSGCTFEEITIPYGVEEIADSAFICCLKLKNIYLPNGLKKIGKSAFELCYNLHGVTIPESVTTIEAKAFEVGALYVKASFGEEPKGWERGDSDNPSWNRSAIVLYQCTFGSDGNYSYVESFVRYDWVNTLSVPTRKGYTFLGWSLTPDSDEIAIGVAEKDGYYYTPSLSDDSKFWIEAKTVTFSPLTLLKDYPNGTVFYAVWQKNEA